MFKVVFTQAARTELIEAQDWYEAQASGLARRFRQSINNLVERMTGNPRQFPVVSKERASRASTPFSLQVFFVVEDDVLLVIACFHGIRDPFQWQRRT